MSVVGVAADARRRGGREPLGTPRPRRDLAHACAETAWARSLVSRPAPKLSKRG